MKKGVKALLLTMCFLFSAQGFAGDQEIAVISLDNEGAEVVTKMDLAQSETGIVKLITTVNDSVLKEVKEKEAEASGFKLKMIAVGLGLTGEIGPAAWKVGAGISHRVFFTKQ